VNEERQFKQARVYLLTLPDSVLARIEKAMPTIRRVATDFDDMDSSTGLDDIDSKQDVERVLGEMDTELDRLLRKGTDDD
jgi:hypothetical protein